MHKYEGLLVYQSHDDDGLLEIVERSGVRSLHFGTYPRQSSMCLQDPHKLELDYVRAMTSWLLFKESPDDALIIGLGGGSIAKFLLHHFPDCRLKAVEHRKSVAKIARSHFALPLDPRLKIIIDDGGQYVCQRAESHQARYSLVIVDAFDHEGMAESISNATFFAACKAVLKNDGILVINLWGGTGNPLFQQVALWMGQIFNWKIIFLPVQGKGNFIGLAFNDKTPLHSLQALKTRADALEQHYQIEFTRFLKDLKKHNASTFNQIVKL